MHRKRDVLRTYMSRRTEAAVLARHVRAPLYLARDPLTHTSCDSCSRRRLLSLGRGTPLFGETTVVPPSLSLSLLFSWLALPLASISRERERKILPSMAGPKLVVTPFGTSTGAVYGRSLLLRDGVVQSRSLVGSPDGGRCRTIGVVIAARLLIKARTILDSR